MKHYIDRDKVVAEINDWIKDARRKYTLSKVQFSLGDRIESLENLLSFINTLEVKEVDMDEEIEKCLKRHSMLAVGKKDFTDIAKHLFELGLKTKGE